MNTNSRIRHPEVLLTLLILGAGIAVFWPGLSGGFLFDDYPNLLLETSWRLTSLQPEHLLRATGHGGAGPLGRPLALLSLGVNYYFTGLDTFWLKFSSLLHHLFNGALVFGFCRLLFNSLPGTSSTTRPGLLAAAAIALAWLVHPLHVSTVLYIVQRMEIGSATGVLIFLYGYVRARQHQLQGQKSWPWLLLAAGGMALGIGFKESAVVGFGLSFLTELIILRFSNHKATLSRTWVTAYALSFAGALAIFLLYIVPMASPNGLYAIRAFTMEERLLTQLPILTMYLKQIIAPWPDFLTFYYDDFPLSRGLFSPPTTAVAFTLLALLLGIAVAVRRHWPLTAFGIGWFFIGHVLTSNIIPLELAFEHRNYLALLGVLLAVVQPLSALAARLKLTRGAAVAILMAGIAGLGSLGAIQSASWGDPLLLAMTLEHRNPNSPRASYNLGMEYLRTSGDDPSNPLWTMAGDQFAIAAKLPGASALPIQGVILLRARANHPVAPEHWEQLRSALTHSLMGPESLSALYAISTCRIENRCQLDDRQLLATFFSVLERNPDSAAVHTLYSNFAWNVISDQELAIRSQRKAVELSPFNPGYRVALAKFLLATGNPDSREEARTLVEQLQRENIDGFLDQDLEELSNLANARF